MSSIGYHRAKAERARKAAAERAASTRPQTPDLLAALVESVGNVHGPAAAEHVARMEVALGEPVSGDLVPGPYDDEEYLR